MNDDGHFECVEKSQPNGDKKGRDDESSFDHNNDNKDNNRDNDKDTEKTHQDEDSVRTEPRCRHDEELTDSC